MIIDAVARVHVLLLKATKSEINVEKGAFRRRRKIQRSQRFVIDFKKAAQRPHKPTY